MPPRFFSRSHFLASTPLRTDYHHKTNCYTDREPWQSTDKEGQPHVRVFAGEVDDRNSEDAHECAESSTQDSEGNGDDNDSYEDRDWIRSSSRSWCHRGAHEWCSRGSCDLANLRQPTTKQPMKAAPARGRPTRRKNVIGRMRTSCASRGVLGLCRRDHAPSSGTASMEKKAKNRDAPSRPNAALLITSFTDLLYSFPPVEVAFAAAH